MRSHRTRYAATCLILTLSTVFGAVPANAAEETGPPQPEAVVMTRTCEQNGALVVMNNLGGGSVAFTVLADNEASGTYTVSAGSAANHLVPIMEDRTVAIQVTADGMSPVAATRTRDCENPEPATADTPAGATDPVDAVPAGTTAPEPVPPPTAVAGASAAPDTTGTSDAAIAPAGTAAPSGELPFTGPPSLGWVFVAGLGLIAAGMAFAMSGGRTRRVSRVSAG